MNSQKNNEYCFEFFDSVSIAWNEFRSSIKYFSDLILW